MTKEKFVDSRYPSPRNLAFSNEGLATPEEMMLRYRGMILAVAQAILGDFHAAEDVAQETFLTAFERMHQLRNPEALGGWLRRIAISRCNRLRRARTTESQLQAAGAVESQQPDPAELLQKAERRRRVHEAIRGLPEHHRTAVEFFYIRGLSQREIARYLDVPCTTVKKRLHDARTKLKAKLSTRD
jgi:RNA polymerase sigma factor (sigma-70 family)